MPLTSENLIEDWVDVCNLSKTRHHFTSMEAANKGHNPKRKGPSSNFSYGSGAQMSLTHPFRLVVIR